MNKSYLNDTLDPAPLLHKGTSRRQLVGKATAEPRSLAQAGSLKALLVAAMETPWTKSIGVA